MKKSLIALAVLAAAGAASAQSSVTLFGVVDASYQNLRADGAGSINRLHNSGNSSSRLGFRGTEDLGGGMFAGFHLEMGHNNDSGAGQNTNTNNQTTGSTGGGGLTFNRKSTLSLGGTWGELRLGRDYTPTWYWANYDPFGTVGVADPGKLFVGAGSGTGALTAQTPVRASNSIAYLTPGNLGGFGAHVMYGMGENASGTPTSKDGRYVGLRVSYDGGPISVGASVGNTDYATGDYRVANLSGSYDFGMAKLMVSWQKDELKNGVPTNKQNSWLLGAIMPVGAGQIKASFTRANVAGTSNDADQLAIGYVHNLSKRTAVYTTYARTNNKGTGIGYHNGLKAVTAGGNTSGLELGVRHSF